MSPVSRSPSDPCRMDEPRFRERPPCAIPVGMRNARFGVVRARHGQPGATFFGSTTADAEGLRPQPQHGAAPFDQVRRAIFGVQHPQFGIDPQCVVQRRRQVFGANHLLKRIRRVFV